jgi:hypothetical protein
MRWKALCAASLVAGLPVLPAAAGVCDSDVRPAATLLLPYFEVNLNNAQGANTIFTVNNAYSAAVLAHVTLWSDLSVPVLDFNVYLTGYDMQAINLRDLIVNGTLPQTASDGQDPTDAISPQGPLSQDINFASCAGQFPLPPLPPFFITYLQSALTGKPAVLLGNTCVGHNYGDNIARGYITVDTVNNCTLRFATDAGYFGAGGTGDATNDNVLWGDYRYVNRNKGLSEGSNMVAIEASSTDPETSANGQYTFYGRYVNWSAADNREPLPTTFGAPYATDRSDLVVWRDSKVRLSTGFSCPATAPYEPLGQEAIVLFDDQENASEVSSNPFPIEAQRVKVGGAALPSAFNGGWAYLNLNATVPAAGANPPEDPSAAQAWVTSVIRSQNGDFSIGYDAMRYDSACRANHLNPPN